ncbi:hypothetical protein PIB30_094806 [Stylosanthes scabra]|uniref:Uncharacterized protein n=1 Tax=Stylosanthes scabra TaxID=79078 RepID=A0ABU6QWC2_9FABA|nr:hypothetical protein [Stylosanthes scabra]
MAITSTSELRLTHCLRLREALFILYVFIATLRYGYLVFPSISAKILSYVVFVFPRFLLFQGHSSSNKGPELPPMRMNEEAKEGLDGAIASLRMH